jgi:hypothetical protein
VQFFITINLLTRDDSIHPSFLRQKNVAAASAYIPYTFLRGPSAENAQDVRLISEGNGKLK